MNLSLPQISRDNKPWLGPGFDQLLCFQDLVLGMRCIYSLRHRLGQRAIQLASKPGLGITELAEDDLWETPGDISSLHQHNQGILVYDKARGFFDRAFRPRGVSLGEIDSQTRSWLSSADPGQMHHDGIFGAGVLEAGRYIRADFLQLEKDGTWTLTLIKSGVKLKERYVLEADWIIKGFQRLGLAIHLVRVFHPDKNYQREESLDLQGFFTSESLTSRVKHLRRGFEDREQAVLHDLIHAPQNGTCRQPMFCGYCTAVPMPVTTEIHPDVSNLFRAGAAVRLLREQGITSILDLPGAQGDARRYLKPRHWIQYQAYKTREPVVDSQALVRFLDGLTFPLYCLDFESIHQAVPPYRGLHPWEHMPFAYSVCRVDDPNTLEIADSQVFIADPGTDGRPEMTTRLRSLLGTSRGSVLVYGQEFERFVLRRLSALDPEAAGDLQGIMERIVDLQTPFAEFWYYHPLQGGKVSLKNILPLFSSQTLYQDLEVQNGADASLGYYFLSYSDQAPDDAGQRQQLGLESAQEFLPKLELYSRLDTEGLIAILQGLMALVG